MGLLYNWGFFTVLGYSPFLMRPITPQQLGFVFFAWGVLVAVFAVWGAPWLKRHFGTAPTLYCNFALMAIDIALIAIYMLSNLPIGVWMLFTFFRETPKAIIEASRIDGAGGNT